ncbi:MAG: helix-turn-helix transcriptional regulator [Oscillospiraceae bacterium]|nr:helix-turn-helix transcriptional regulator [Oscillospiraceae bacterium]
MELLCHNIRNIRSHYKLSQKEMAQRLHIGIGSLRKLENGYVPPRLDIEILFYIHKEFGFTPSQTLSVDLLQYIRSCGSTDHTV